MRKSYPSDISREQFEKIRPILESVRKKTKPRTLDLYEIFCALLYILKTGCQWRALPNDYPNWKSVHVYFRLWRKKEANEESILEKVLKKISWRSPCEPRAQGEDKFSDRGRPER